MLRASGRLAALYVGAQAQIALTKYPETLSNSCAAELIKRAVDAALAANDAACDRVAPEVGVD